MKQRLDSILSEAIASGRVPCVTAAVTTADEVLYEGAFGSADLEGNTPVAPDSVFRIASMTKAVTSVAAMQLVEQGQIGLDQPAAELVDRLNEVGVLNGYDDSGAPRFRPPSQPPTIRQLLSHTSGFGYHAWNADLAEFAARTGKPDPASAAGILDLPMVHDPGTKWEYSSSTDWLGAVVESASGLSLETYFRQHILDPLAMSDTTFLPKPSQLDRLVALRHRQPDDSLPAAEMPMDLEPDFFSGGGGLISTATDYVRFLQALLNGGALGDARILSSQSIDAMAQPEPATAGAGHMPAVIPAMTNPVAFRPETECKFGLGFLINSGPLNTGRPAGGMEWAGLFNSYYWLDRTTGVAGTILMQLLPFVDTEAIAIYESFERGVYESL
ncbi:MAG TPA: serine hydrolase domain-containing protein [Dehalococcoidia bacterium]|nr:serine hydrolase domain-containing protein [Dehalococcoidia bacterium]